MMIVKCLLHRSNTLPCLNILHTVPTTDAQCTIGYLDLFLYSFSCVFLLACSTLRKCLFTEDLRGPKGLIRISRLKEYLLLKF